MFIAALAKRVCQQRQSKKLSINGMVVTHLADAVHDAARLKELQALPLERKIQITQTRIIEWYEHYNGQVCVSFSGGKDSTVLLHIARRLYPNIPAVFSNTGLEYPEIQRFVKSFDNVDIVTPSMRFDDVITTYGYPLIGKEVAEAIYYARRLRSHSVNAERERESIRAAANRRNSSVTEPHLNECRRKQTDDTARPLGMQCEWKRMEIGGWAESEKSGDQRCAHDRREPQPTTKSRDSKWSDYHRRTLHSNEADPRDKDCFWNKPRETEWADWRRGCL